MLRRNSSRVALVAAASGVAALTSVGARADDAVFAVPTFAIELKVDEMVVDVVEPTAPTLSLYALPADVFSQDSAFSRDYVPFLNQPAPKLGLPPLGDPDVVVANRFADEDLCAARCNDLAGRMAVRVEDQAVRLSVGATASVADRLGSFGSGGDRPKWYLFVAADAQAMSWGFNKDDHSSSVRLDDMRMLGDAQAGLGGRVGGGDLAIGYVSREVSHMGAERRENFVGLTFGWEG